MTAALAPGICNAGRNCLGTKPEISRGKRGKRGSGLSQTGSYARLRSWAAWIAEEEGGLEGYLGDLAWGSYKPVDDVTKIRATQAPRVASSVEVIDEAKEGLELKGGNVISMAFFSARRGRSRELIYDRCKPLDVMGNLCLAAVGG